ncbi:MAG: hypothetical protein WAM58_18575 [Candidatus Acidiferrum sp.]
MSLGLALVLVVILVLLQLNNCWGGIWRGLKKTGRWLAISFAVATLVWAAVIAAVRYDANRKARELEESQTEQHAKVCIDNWNGDRTPYTKTMENKKPWDGDSGTPCDDVSGPWNLEEHTAPVPDLTQAAKDAGATPTPEVKGLPAGATVDKDPWEDSIPAPPPGPIHWTPAPRPVTRLRVRSIYYQVQLVSEIFGDGDCGVLDAGEVVTLLEKNGTQVKVKSASGQVGWTDASNFEVVR